MFDKKVARPVALAVGAALAGSFAIAGTANAETGASPFAMSALSAGYMLGAGEGGCGADKQAHAGDAHAKGAKGAEGSCGGDEAKGEMDAKGAEGSCGGDKAKDEMGDKGAEGSCGGDKESMPEDKGAEGKCGEGKCGGDSQ